MAGTVTKTRASNFIGEMREIRWTLEVVGDAAAGTVPDTTIKDMEGYYLQEVITTPGTGGDVPDAYTLDVKEGSFSIVDLAARSTTDEERVSGHTTLGYYPKIKQALTVSVGDVGISNTATIEILFVHEA